MAQAGYLDYGKFKDWQKNLKGNTEGSLTTLEQDRLFTELIEQLKPSEESGFKYMSDPETGRTILNPDYGTESMSGKINWTGTAPSKLPERPIEWTGTDPSSVLGNIDDVVKRWQENIATPMMGAWEKTAKPLAAEKFNLPGSFYSADRARGMQRESEDFLSSLLPSLFESTENFATRSSQMYGDYYNRLFGQDVLEAEQRQKGDIFDATREESYLDRLFRQDVYKQDSLMNRYGILAGLASGQRYENIIQQESPDSTGQLLSSAMMMFAFM